MESFYKVKQERPGVYSICGVGIEWAYLVNGEEGSCLIDSCTGYADFRPAVEAVAREKITVALTHGHVDHCGGALFFPECLVAREDMASLERGASVKARAGFIRGKSEEAFQRMGGEAAFSQPGNTEFLPVEDGQQIDLGGVVLEARHIPGHTQGCMMYIDRAHKCAFTGDMVLDHTVLLTMPDSSDMERYCQSLEQILALFASGEIDIVYTGHGCGTGDAALVQELLDTARAIDAGTDDHVPHSFYGRACFLAHRAHSVGVNVLDRDDGKPGNIAYLR